MGEKGTNKTAEFGVLNRIEREEREEFLYSRRNETVEGDVLF